MHIFKKRWLVLMALMVLLAACSPSLLSGGTSMNVSSDKGGMTTARVALIHQPTGMVIVSWNPTNHVLMVTLHMSGLTPLSRHPAHIHQSSSCQAGGPILFALHPVMVNAVGVGTSTTSLMSSTGIPRTGWSINVHNGPGLTSAVESLPLVCVALHNYSRIHGLLVLRYALDPTPAADQNGSGQAQLSVANHQLTVTVVVHGLVPGSVHMEHIHVGTCARQGLVLFPLKNLVAGPDGTAMATTIINKSPQIPVGRWYLNVHRSVPLIDPSGKINTTNFDPIVCGDIR